MDTKNLDKLIYVAIVNGYTLSKENGTFLLTNVDPTNPAHKFILSCMNDVKQITGVKTRISLQKWKLFSWLKLKHRFKFLKGFKLTWRAGKKIDDFIYDIENVNDADGAFAEAWRTYYVD